MFVAFMSPKIVPIFFLHILSDQWLVTSCLDAQLDKETDEVERIAGVLGRKHTCLFRSKKKFSRAN